LPHSIDDTVDDDTGPGPSDNNTNANRMVGTEGMNVHNEEEAGQELFYNGTSVSATSFPAGAGAAAADVSQNQQSEDVAHNIASNRLVNNNEDAFSSSSEEDYDVNSNRGGRRGRRTVDGTDSKNKRNDSNGAKEGGSEFDRALQTSQGVPSRGVMKTQHQQQQQQQQQPVRAAVAMATDPQRHQINPQHSMTSTAGSADANNISHTPSSWENTSMHHQYQNTSIIDDETLSSGVLPDVLMTMRQKIESMTLFDSQMLKLATGATGGAEQETRESLKRSSQQSISAAVLVSLAHKRYERRRLAAMEIEKVVRGLAQQDELDRVRAILLLLSDDYVRSTSEDARKGGVVALAASAIGLKKASDSNPTTHECRDLILASVVHACQDHSQRVRYYATESLFNVIKVIPSLAVQHFFILFEILRSLYADVDPDVKSGAELLDKKLKEVIVGAMNAGSFTADACVPVFARFVYMRNKATKRLTLTWLQELTDKLIGAPILEYLHLFLTGIFDMVADPTVVIRQSALAFLQSILPKLLDNHVVEEAIDDFQSSGVRVDFDKILQSLVTTMEHPDPLVRKISIYWVSKIVKAHIGGSNVKDIGQLVPGSEDDGDKKEELTVVSLSAATLSVRNALPHVLPGILLSIGDKFHSKSNMKDTFLPDTTTHTLAEQTNACVQQAVRADGKSYVHHLDSFIVALREELDSPGGVSAKNPPAIERKPYRMDVKSDGTGIESQGWFRASVDTKEDDIDSMMMSRLCALHWIIVLYESVVPDVLKADYAREFIVPVIHQLVDNPPERIIFKSLEVLAKITVPVPGERMPDSYSRTLSSHSLSGLVPSSPSWMGSDPDSSEADGSFPMNDASVGFALDILDKPRRLLKSRDREVFRVLIQLHAHNLHLIGRLSKVVAYMCRLQPPEFIFVSFAVELDRFVSRESKVQREDAASQIHMGRIYQFVSAFIQQMCLVLLNSKETYVLRGILKDCIGFSNESIERDQRRCRLFHILLHTFAHNLVASISLCLWGGACRTASLFLKKIDPLDINLVFLLELDKLVEMLERPLFRHLHVRMLEIDTDPQMEGSGTMLFQTLKEILMIIPQSACYSVLSDRLVSTSRFRQSVISNKSAKDDSNLGKWTEVFVSRVVKVRKMHCKIVWKNVRAESLETITSQAGSDLNQREQQAEKLNHEPGADRREWLGYASKEEEMTAQKKYEEDKGTRDKVKIEEIHEGYEDLTGVKGRVPAVQLFNDDDADGTRKSAGVPSTSPSSSSVADGETTNNNDENDGHTKNDNITTEPTSTENESWKEFWSEPDSN